MSGQNELSELWIGQPTQGESNGEELITMAQERIQRLDRTVTMRNLWECLASGGVATYFAFQSIRQPNAVAKAGYLIVAAGALWIIVYLLRYGRSPAAVSTSQSLKDYANALSERYNCQIRLLKSVKYWYLLPMYIGLLLSTAGQSMDQYKHGQLGWLSLAAPGFYTAVFGGLWWLNEVTTVNRMQDEKFNLLSMIDQGAKHE